MKIVEMNSSGASIASSRSSFSSSVHSESLFTVREPSEAQPKRASMGRRILHSRQAQRLLPQAMRKNQRSPRTDASARRLAVQDAAAVEQHYTVEYPPSESGSHTRRSSLNGDSEGSLRQTRRDETAEAGLPPQSSRSRNMFRNIGSLIKGKPDAKRSSNLQSESSSDEKFAKFAPEPKIEAMIYGAPFQSENKRKNAEKACRDLLASLFPAYVETAKGRKISATLVGDFFEKTRGKVRKLYRSPSPPQSEKAADATKNFWSEAQKARGSHGEETSTSEESQSWNRLLRPCMFALSDKDLARIKVAIRHEPTQRALAQALSKIDDTNTRQADALLMQIGLITKAASEKRYLFEPLMQLVNNVRSRDLGESSTRRDPLYTTADLTRDALKKILRGMNEGVAKPNETRAQYLVRAVHSMPVSETELLKRAFCENDEEARLLIHTMECATSNKSMAAQYTRLFRDFRSILANNALTNGVDSDLTFRPRAWPGSFAEVVPKHEAGTIRSTASALLFWGRYSVGSADSRAKMRVEHLEKNVDKRVEALISHLAEVENGRPASASVHRHLRRLHNALDGLRAEFRKQQDPRQDQDYLQDSAQRAMSHRGEKSLRRLWGPMLENGWVPNRAIPLSRYQRLMNHIEARIDNPFRTSTPKTAKNSEETTPRKMQYDQRASVTWAAVRASLEQEHGVRQVKQTLTNMVGFIGSENNQKTNYDGIAQEIENLIRLDALGSSDIDTRPIVFKAALKQLTDKERDILMARLTKYTIQRGGKMLQFMKPEEQGVHRPMETEKWFYTKLLEDLYSAGMSLKWTPRSDNSSEQPKNFEASDSDSMRSSSTLGSATRKARKQIRLGSAISGFVVSTFRKKAQTSAA